MRPSVEGFNFYGFENAAIRSTPSNRNGAAANDVTTVAGVVYAL
jgi:hypothetical protein